MTQSIVVQVGQCGNQIGYRFWDLALREHANVNRPNQEDDDASGGVEFSGFQLKVVTRHTMPLSPSEKESHCSCQCEQFRCIATGVYDESMGSFFRNVDSRGTDDSRDIPVGDSKGKIRTLKARAVLVDMEEGVVSEIMNSPLRDVFDYKQLITDVSGSGNNWAVGHHEYGPQYREQIVESVRRSAEHCDCLQCFFVLHSMGGGTGSGIGTYILGLLQDEFPEVYSARSVAVVKFVTAVFPSDDDDVVTSPYNSVLAIRQLADHADCVLPIENQALADIVNKIQLALPPDKSGKRIFGSSLLANKSRVKEGSALTASEGGITKSRDGKPFDGMNNIVANLLLNLTSSARFEGSLNVDLNEITMNLVPFPRMHYLVSSQTPLYSLTDIKIPARRLDQMFTDAFSHDNQLLKSDPKRGLYLACGLMVRGQVEISDIRRNIERLQPSLHFVHWNREGWKTGLCSVAPVGHPYSLLALANNTCIWRNFQGLRDRFVKLYKRKAHMCHYTRIDSMLEFEFTESLESLTTIINDYQSLEKQMNEPVPCLKRLQVL